MKKSVLSFPLFTAMLFSLLLHRQSAGINVFLLGLGILVLAFFSGRMLTKNKLHIVVSLGIVLSGLMSVFYGSATAVTVTVVSLILFAGLLAAPYLSVLLNGFFCVLIGAFTSPYNYLKGLASVSMGEHKLAKSIRYTGLLIIPLVLVLIFVSMYSAASPYYDRLTGHLMYFIEDFFNWLSKSINPGALWIGIAGLIAGVIIFFSHLPPFFELPGESDGDQLIRQKKESKGTLSSLRFELRSAIIIFLLLNGTLLVMNALDFWYVWIDFKWDGGFLKQFVHEGTWLLIFSIVISVLLVLWFFRGSLNFYPKNRLLKSLAIIWIGQNIFLAFSVAVRNFWYLSYFNLAYKRIWVFAFLLLVIFGLVTVIIKVNNKKSLRYLMIHNSIAAYVVFIALSLFNWDMVIAKFNINRADKAFFHTDFMIGLDSSTLPVLIINEQQLKQVSEAQKGMFYYHKNYMSFEEYNTILLSRKNDFMKEYPNRHWLSWNVADYNAYKKLSDQ